MANGVLDVDVNRGGASITRSNYFTELTMNGTAQVIALATGTTKIEILNRGATTEAIRYAYGETAQEAIDILDIDSDAARGGYWMGSPADGYPPPPPEGRPTNAAYLAVANAVASDTQVVSVTQGV